jgi:hypothetical protein
MHCQVDYGLSNRLDVSVRAKYILRIPNRFDLSQAIESITQRCLDALWTFVSG